MYPILRDRRVSAYAIDSIHTQEMESSFYELEQVKMPWSAFKSGHMAVLLFGCMVTTKHSGRLYQGQVSQICWPDKDEGVLFNVFYPANGDSEDLDFNDFLKGLWSVCECFLGQGAGVVVQLATNSPAQNNMIHNFYRMHSAHLPHNLSTSCLPTCVDEHIYIHA